MDYQERVQALAEKMAASCYNEAFATFTILPPGTIKLFKDLTAGQKKTMVNRMLPAARIVVAEMAEAYKMGRAKGYELGIAWEEGKQIVLTPKFELIEQGLIPDAQEGGNDGKE